MSESIPASREPSPLGRGIRTIGLVIAGFFVLVLGITLLVEAIPIASENSIALIRIEGIIIDPHEVLQQIKHFADDSSIQAIVVRINSPGGAVVPSQEIYAALKRIRDDGEKTVVTSMGNMAASGGYYIASASNTILANPGTITGSIGVIMEMTNVEELLAKVGIESVVVKSGLHKDLASPFRPLSVQSRTILQHVMDDVHDQFIHAVAEGREMGVEQVHALADGRIFTGRQALAVNLVDRLGTLQDAIQLAADLAGITEEPTVIEVEPRFSLQDLILTQLRDSLYEIIRPDIFRLKFEFAL
ncbi:MAG TPA: signal peptide peptidase SppA [Nitrospirales bacterium]|nr:signal peptide peptidase SppA [Nitrospirales bacterium]